MVAAQQTKLWNLPPTVERGTFGGLSLAVAFSCDSHFLAEGELSGEVHIWNLTNLEQVTSISTRAGAIRAVAWPPDGRKLATVARGPAPRVCGIPSVQLLAPYP